MQKRDCHARVVVERNRPNVGRRTGHVADRHGYSASNSVMRASLWKTSMSEWRLPARSLLLGLAVAIANPISAAWSDTACFCCGHVGCNRLLKTGLCTGGLFCRGAYCGCACRAVFPQLHPLWGCFLIRAPH